MAATKGKMGPVYTRPNMPQGGPPARDTEPRLNKTYAGAGNQNTATKGRKTWPGMPVTGN